ncbi:MULTISPECIES: Rieske (2Fe-2S) protein [Microtetraspora]|uniref:Rieske (2Fe-2S) protein n=1 Tax=Microtetraspora glauca TaxID=1996 RepID=A0ABV3GFN6_MICGL|nr:Rieske (2Fe-2S) protein [Microtetraspora sp. AC03309]MCC5575989.1 Rieske (2Fe-2S) protein [Microtetraspora sp. AC03309]
MTSSSSGMPTRRQVLGTAGAAACGVALAGCGAGVPPEPVVPPGIKGKVIAKVAEVPVGGGTVIKDWKIILTQPSEGVFKAFTANCPHKGCLVGRFEGKAVECPCHGSTFAIDTGACLSGPAGAPLKEFPLKVEGDGIVIV